MDRDRAIGFDRVIDDIAAGRRDDDAVSTLAARLAALDRKIDDKARAVIANATGGLDPKALAHKLLDAIDPDTIEREAAGRLVGPQAAAEALKDEACRPFDDPALRRLLKDIKRQTEIRIDAISTDAVISSGYDAARAQDTVERFRQFLAEHRDSPPDSLRTAACHAASRPRGDRGTAGRDAPPALAVGANRHLARL